MRTVVVLGMHRSGTSALVRALGLLGAEMSPVDHLGKHWENKYLRNINVKLLDAGGGVWDAPPLGDNWLAKVDAQGLPELAAERIAQEFGDAEVAVWKDPRTCLTLPFWRPFLGDDPVIVLIHRHPYEVARSLEARIRIGPGLSFALWERYNADALRFSDGLPTTVVSYADVLSRPAEVMTELTGHLRESGIDLPNDPATTDLEVKPGERHHVSATSDALDLPIATASQRALFDALASLEGYHKSLQTPTDLPRPHPLSVELMRAAGKLRRVRRRHKSGRGGSDGKVSPQKEATGSA